ncbi:unnamed protein product [Arctogadus glacialis]
MEMEPQRHIKDSQSPCADILSYLAGRRCLDQLATAGPPGLVEARVAFEVTEQEEQEEEVEEEEELQQAYGAFWRGGVALRAEG